MLIEVCEYCGAKNTNGGRNKKTKQLVCNDCIWYELENGYLSFP